MKKGSAVRRKNRQLVVLAAVAVALAIMAPAGASQAPDPMTLERQDPTSVDRTSRIGISGLDTPLEQAARMAEEGVAAPQDPMTVEAQVLLSTTPGASFRADVSALGGQIKAERGTSALVEIPTDGLRGLAALDGVTSVREPVRPIALAIESEGVAESGADLWQLDGYDGTGTKVAIIDLSFADYVAAQAAEELPADVEIVNNCASFTGSDPHGTAVAEIVHDMAPQADLALICVESIFDVESAADWVIANGVDVVVHSVAWLNSSRGDGTQTAPSPDNAVFRANQAGILWVNAAGNFAEDHYGAAFVPTTSAGTIVHDWGGGDPDMNILVPAGQAIEVYMKYDGWPITQEDYDLVLYDINSAILTFSFGDQTTAPGAEPVEYLFYVNNTGSDQTVFLEVQRFSGTQNLTMDFFVLGHNGIEANTVARSVVEPASSPYATAVGAVCWSTDTLETFSSQGPTIDGRVKPDISAADGVSTFGFGETVAGNCFSSFPGTSSAAPHVGGAAALVLDARPHFTPDEVMDFLGDLTLDSGPAGLDNQYGIGELRMGEPVSYFSDIDNSTFKNDIEWLFEEGITGGCSTVPPEFCPSDSITRGQMAAFLKRALVLPDTATDYFSDDDGTTFENDINSLAAAGITNGCKLGPDSYCPGDNVTRAQMASFLVDAFDLPASAVDEFGDDDASVHEPNINALAASGITGGCALENSYCPGNDVTRGQMAAFLKRALTAG